jgi:hypothetical protein
MTRMHRVVVGKVRVLVISIVQALLSNSKTLLCSCRCTFRVLQLQQLQQEFEQLPHPNMQYPDYYTVPFHAYDEGNLNWQVGLTNSTAGAAGSL